MGSRAQGGLQSVGEIIVHNHDANMNELQYLSSYSSSHLALSRQAVLGDRPVAPSPRVAFSASGESFVETPLSQSRWISASTDGERRGQGGRMRLLNRWPSRRSRTRGCSTSPPPGGSGCCA